MTYFETPNDRDAYVLGMSTADYERMLAAEEAAAEAAEDEAEHTDPERFVSEDDFNAATPQDWADLQAVLDWEAFEGFGS